MLADDTLSYNYFNLLKISSMLLKDPILSIGTISKLYLEKNENDVEIDSQRFDLELSTIA
jgi:hypothetical protein